MYLYSRGYKYSNNVNEISQVNYENYKLFDYFTGQKNNCEIEKEEFISYIL